MFWLWQMWRRIGGWRTIAAQALLVSRLVPDRRVPVGAKLILVAAGVYFVTPLNLSFEWIPFIGQIDDLGIALLAMSAFLKACPADVVAEHAARLEQEIVREGRWGRLGELIRPSFGRWTPRRPPGDGAAPPPY
jgi:uncharacterized membrane protein YkvA (DUF1232 family)